MALSAVLALAACGSGGQDVAEDPVTPSPSASAAFSSQESAYLKESRRWASSIEEPDSLAGKESLLAIGRDWCRWRQSPDFGSISADQFFGEVLIDARDGRGIREAAEKHLCSS